MTAEIREPRSAVEWQNAVDAATGALAFESAREYGLIIGGPVVNAERCEHLIAEGEKKGVTPSRDAVARFTFALAATALGAGVRP